MFPEDLGYFRERALEERQRAAQSTNHHVIEIHTKLADLYEQLVGIEENATPANDAAAIDRAHRQA